MNQTAIYWTLVPLLPKFQSLGVMTPCHPSGYSTEVTGFLRTRIRDIISHPFQQSSTFVDQHA